MAAGEYHFMTNHNVYMLQIKFYMETLYNNKKNHYSNGTGMVQNIPSCLWSCSYHPEIRIDILGWKFNIEFYFQKKAYIKFTKR